VHARRQPQSDEQLELLSLELDEHESLDDDQSPEAPPPSNEPPPPPLNA